MTKFKATDERKKPFLWIDALIDDWQLTPVEVRVYIAIVRRAGKLGGTCFESIGSLAKRLKISDKTISRSLDSLTSLNVIEKYPRTGKPSEYKLTDSSTWIPRTPEPEVTTPDTTTGGSVGGGGRTPRPEGVGHHDRTNKIPQSDHINHFLKEGKKNEPVENAMEGAQHPGTSASSDQNLPLLKAQTTNEAIVPPPHIVNSCENFEQQFLYAQSENAFAWRVSGTRQSEILPEFVGYIIRHLSASDHYKQKGGANMAHAKAWIRKRERNLDGLEELGDHLRECEKSLAAEQAAQEQIKTHSDEPLAAVADLESPAIAGPRRREEKTRDELVAMIQARVSVANRLPAKKASFLNQAHQLCLEHGIDFDTEVYTDEFAQSCKILDPMTGNNGDLL